MERASHALAAGGGVWLVDPVDFPGLDERVCPLGAPRAVLQLLDWHARDCAAIAARLGVPHLVMPADGAGVAVRGLPDPGRPALEGDRRSGGRSGGRSSSPRRSAPRATTARPGRRLGVHPCFALFRPPTVLLGYEPEHLLVGHGAGLHDDVPAALEEASGARAATSRASCRAVGSEAGGVVRCAVVLFTRDLRVHDNPAARRGGARGRARAAAVRARRRAARRLRTACGAARRGAR